ncbi:MAG: SsrA-binding protein SmpB [Anaerolineales bacterium]|nr:MAG: SsrA-binding protein SmpB [Anaerolineales bacterium]
MGRMSGKNITRNKKAFFNFHILDTFEAGLVLQGSEIKSIRNHQISIDQAYIHVDGEEAWLIDSYIHPYEQASSFNHNPQRRRKLLLHKKEIVEMWDKVRIKGHTIVPLRVYLSNGKAKIEIAVAKGKKLHDKRRDIAERESDRQTERDLRQIGL